MFLPSDWIKQHELPCGLNYEYSNEADIWLAKSHPAELRG